MALSGKTLKKWYWVHKWTSLVCTLFLLMLCITGLPLIFHSEIDDLTRAPEFSVVEETGVKASLDRIVEDAKSEKPDWVLLFLTWDTESPMVSAIVGPSMKAQESDVLILSYDSRTGERLLIPPANEGVMYFLLDLHASMLMGLPGTLFLGLMGFVFMVSVVSGIVVYAPFMRRISFATVRKQRSKRIKWLDTHNMVGIITIAWVVVVGLSGIILTLISPITAIWQQGQLAEIAAPYKALPPSDKPVSADVVQKSIFEQVPNADISFISWPGSPFATPHHYTVALRGDTPLTERLVKIALVDADSGNITSIEETPWYITAINLSVPLHFGDYGQLPLKIIWAVFDIACIVILVTGLYLWWKRRNKSIDTRIDELADVKNMGRSV